ncbi:MAG: hypothetical protein ACRD0O_14560, partial [Acidimicrobiia bacterium]
MKTALKTIALLVLMTLVSAACASGGESGAARARLGGGPGTEGSQPSSNRAVGEPPAKTGPTEAGVGTPSPGAEDPAGTPPPNAGSGSAPPATTAATATSARPPTG